MLLPADAVDQAAAWATTMAVGGSELPLMTVDLRGLDRSFIRDGQHEQLAALLLDSSWVNVGIVDDGLDPVFAPLADSFDVLVGDNTASAAAVDTDDIDAVLADLTTSIANSPQASVELVRLLRLTHQLPVAQALHAESLTYAVLQSSQHFQQWLASRPSDRSASAQSEPAVLLDRADSLLRITLNRPNRRNALNTAMRDQLVEALELIDLDSSIDGAILSGAGDNFSAGGDLGEFGSTPSAAMGHYVRMMRSVGALMHRVAARVRVHVHGTCVGAGIEVPAFSNAVIAHPDATFRLPEVGFGLVPGAGGTVSITRRCGRHRTAWLALTGTVIDAPHALRWQIVDRVDASVFESSS